MHKVLYLEKRKPSQIKVSLALLVTVANTERMDFL
jgi:hypothetical protein